MSKFAIRLFAPGAFAVFTFVSFTSSAQAQDRLISGGIGIGLAYSPSFPGAGTSDTSAFPVIDLTIGRYGFFNQRGLGLQNGVELQDRRLTYGIGIGYDFDERRAEEDTRLTGLADVEPGANVTLFAEYETGAMRFGVDLQRGLSSDGHEGTRIKAQASYDWELSPRAGMTLTPYLVWADDNWMSAFYGVTAQESHASGLTEFHADSGLSEGGVTLSASYALSPRTILFSSLEVARLTGDAKDSSVSFDDTQTRFASGLMFRF